MNTTNLLTNSESSLNLISKLGLDNLSNNTIVMIVILITVWSLVWKGFALWHSAKNGHKWWFIIFMIANTVGILEIIYLKFLQKKQK